MAANRVYVFAKTQPSPITFLAEIRSAVEKGGKTISSMQIKMMGRNERQVRRPSPRPSKYTDPTGFYRVDLRSRLPFPTSVTTFPSLSSSVRSTSSPTRTSSTTSATIETIPNSSRCSSLVSRTPSPFNTER
jgi:hypothetical protein